MAEIQYTYKDATHTIHTYEDVLTTYNWIIDALKVVCGNQEATQINCSVAFSADEMSYRCDSIEEFKKYAFGRDIQIKRMLIYVYENNIGSLINVFAADYKDVDQQEFSISSQDEMLIINLREALSLNKKIASKSKETIVMNIKNNSVHIGSNNQISDSVIGLKNVSDVEKTNIISRNEKESFLSKTFWQIIIPIIVGIILAIILVCLGLD